MNLLNWLKDYLLSKWQWLKLCLVLTWTQLKDWFKSLGSNDKGDNT